MKNLQVVGIFSLRKLGLDLVFELQQPGKVKSGFDSQITAQNFYYSPHPDLSGVSMSKVELWKISLQILILN
jgi:hypothetical protein